MAVLNANLRPALQPPLWPQLQGAADILLAVRGGQSMAAALEGVAATLRPGVQALSFHVLRHLGRAEALCQQLATRPPPPASQALLCVALSLLQNEPTTDADISTAALAQAMSYAPFTVVNQAVEAAKRHAATQHQAKFINGCLRRMLREQQTLIAQTNISLSARWNHPLWWIELLQQDYPQDWPGILQANNRQAPLILRVNARKTTQAQYLQALSAINIKAFAVGDQGLVLQQACAVPTLPGFADGWFSVQDAGAQLAAPRLLAGLLPGTGSQLRLLDACAAPGGKTAHLLELADAHVTALDVDPQRCARMAQNLGRLGLQADIQVADAAAPPTWWDGQAYDGILLDAPCTASGIVRRHPDVRWLRRASDIAQLAQTQAQLLSALWPLLRPGGRLLYCTCSVFKAEGEQQIAAFLAHHKQAVRLPAAGHLLPQSRILGADLPDNSTGEHDGFYYACLEKQS